MQEKSSKTNRIRFSTSNHQQHAVLKVGEGKTAVVTSKRNARQGVFIRSESIVFLHVEMLFVLSYLGTRRALRVPREEQSSVTCNDQIFSLSNNPD